MQPEAVTKSIPSLPQLDLLIAYSAPRCNGFVSLRAENKWRWGPHNHRDPLLLLHSAYFAGNFAPGPYATIAPPSLSLRAESWLAKTDLMSAEMWFVIVKGLSSLYFVFVVSVVFTVVDDIFGGEV